MADRRYLGEFEHVVLLAVLSLGAEAYGIRIREAIRDRGGRRVSVPTVYSALDRLEGKGYLTARTGDPTPERGGRAKKLFEVTGEGLEALERSRAMLQRMWDLAGGSLASGAGEEG